MDFRATLPLVTASVTLPLNKRLQNIQIFEAVPKSIKFSESNLAGEPIHIYAKDPKLVQPYQLIANLIAAI
jgi:chromosome partitioning protein